MIQINKEEDIQKILTIPNDQVSEELKKAIREYEIYQDVEDLKEHLYSPEEVLYTVEMTAIEREEYLGIMEVCNENEISYFRIAAN